MTQCTTLVGDVNSRGGGAHLEIRVIWGILILPTQFYYEPKIIIKNKSYGQAFDPVVKSPLGMSAFHNEVPGVSPGYSTSHPVSS